MHHAAPARLPFTAIGASIARIFGLARAFWDSFVASLAPADDAEARIVDRQLDILRANTRLIPYAVPAAAVAGALSVSEWVGWTTLSIWLALLIVAAAVHEFVGHHYQLRPRSTVAHVRRRAVAMTVACFIYLLIWSAFGILAWAPDIVVSHYLVAFVLGCTLAAACTMGAAHTASVVSVAVPAGLLMVIQPLVTDALNPMTGICVVYVVLMAAFARASHMTATRALRLEDDRAGLIASLRQARDESDAARKRAEAANLAKSEFLANMSHELRTPLNAIIGFSDIIRTRAMGPAREKYVEYAGFINESGNHLLTLISEMLELAKIEAGRKTLREEEIDLDEVMAAAARDAQPAANDREITIEAARNGALPAIIADRNALQQILMQLLSNAVQFSQPQGYVSIGAHVTETGEVAVIVADNGVGIAPDDQLHVFDRFGRGQHDIAKQNKGAGLGLPIAKGLVELHGGRIGITSAPGEGTRVTVTFPASRTVAGETRHAVSA